MARRLRTDALYDQDGYISECHPDSIYLITSGPGRPVKIGKTNNVGRRLANLQQGNHSKLEVTATLPVTSHLTEGGVHKLFEQHLISGEWYEPHWDIFKFFGATGAAV